MWAKIRKILLLILSWFGLWKKPTIKVKL